MGTAGTSTRKRNTCCKHAPHKNGGLLQGTKDETKQDAPQPGPQGAIAEPKGQGAIAEPKRQGAIAEPKSYWI